MIGDAKRALTGAIPAYAASRRRHLLLTLSLFQAFLPDSSDPARNMRRVDRQDGCSMQDSLYDAHACGASSHSSVDRAWTVQPASRSSDSIPPRMMHRDSQEMGGQVEMEESFICWRCSAQLPWSLGQSFCYT
jgi:hypothetical protein